MKKKDVLEGILVEDYAAQGKALARVDGKVVFIDGAVPGDVVTIRITRSKKDWADAKVMAVTSLSAERATPFCKHFGVCGGCKWQMLPYEKQLFYKQREVEDNLTRLSKVVLPPVQPIIGSAKNRFYRNKLEYTFSHKRFLLPGELGQNPPVEVGPAVGLHAPGWFDKVIDIEECYLMDEPVNAIRNGIRAFALENGYTFYDIRNHTGWLRNLIIRNTTLGELMVNMVLAYDDPEKETLLNFIRDSFPQISTLLYTINNKMNDTIYDRPVYTYSGSGFITEQLEDFRFKIGPKSFFQTNTAQGEQLYRITRQLAQLDGSQVLYDLYCGTGSIGIFCSRGAKKVVGVELVPEAIEDARVNAAMNNVTHSHFVAGDAITVCNEEFFAVHGRPGVIITDPPRAGMHGRLIEKLLEIAAPTLVYVSCNPATQARDLQLLDEKYAVTHIQPVDMFPHTHHIENVVQLKLRGVDT
jgi:23S rRNA (uracil1939-C5)-methyltransferase